MGLDFIEKSAFENCKSLKEINFPSSLTEIGSRAFYGCKNLKDVVFTPEKRVVRGKVLDKLIKRASKD